MLSLLLLLFDVALLSGLDVVGVFSSAIAPVNER
jgi:hypothetical protein